MPSLGLAGARRPGCQVDQTIEHAGFQRASVERTCHPASSDDLGELGHDIAVGEERAWGRRLAKRFGVDAKYDANSFIAATGSADGYLDHESSKPDKLDAEVVKMFDAVPASKGGAIVVYGWTMAEDLLKLGKR